MSFGLFEFEPGTGELRRQGTPVKLAPQPARVLALLVSRPGEVIVRDEFRRELWGEDTFVDFERGLNFCITQTRAALGDAADNPRFIQTVPRRGYRFIAPVTPVAPRNLASNAGATAVPTATSVAATERVQTEPPAQVRETLQATGLAGHELGPPSATNGGRARKSWAVVASVAGIALLVLWGVASRRAATSAAAAAPLRVAVLPFANLTGDSTLEYLADGLTDEVITQLGSLTRDRVAVIARTSVMVYRGTATPVADIARALEVQYVIEGSVKRDGPTLRITASVVPAHAQTAISWADEVIDVPSLAAANAQSPVAIRLASHVAGELIGAQETPPGRPLNAAAWDMFLQASSALRRGTPGDVRYAIEQLESATARDPQFGEAWARLAQAHHLLVMMGASAPDAAYPRARAAAERALANGGDLAEAQVANGLVQLWYGWNPQGAASSFRKAIDLNPSLAVAHHDYAWALVALGHVDDAVRHIEHSRTLDPLSPRANNDVGWLRLFVRQPAQAAQACRRTLALDAQSLEAQACLERAYAHQQQFDAALHAARATLHAPAEDVALLGTGAEGLRQIWLWRVRQLERAAEQRWVSPYTMAVHYALVGDQGRALTALEQARTARVGMMVFVARDPAMDALRTEPRFLALVRQITETTF